MFGKPDKPEGTGQRDPVRTATKVNPALEAKAGQPARDAGAESGAPSVICADMKVVGNLQSGGDIQIEGTVEGDIKSRMLTIGESANIEGSISADSVRICGSVSGQVKAPTVTIAKTAKVAGDITYKTLAVEEGAFLEGHFRHFDTAKGGAEAKVAEIKRPAPEAAKPAPAPGGAASPGGASSSSAGGKPLAG